MSNASQFDVTGKAESVTVKDVTERFHQKRSRIIRIGGCGGSGKTALASLVHRAISESAIVHLDDFAQPGTPGWDEARFMRCVMTPYAAVQTARYQRYDWDNNRLAEWHEIDPGVAMIVEGVTAVTVDTLGLVAFDVWVDAPRSMRLNRGVARDGEAMRSTWTDIWMSEEDRYVEQYQPFDAVDLIVDGTVPMDDSSQ